MSSNIKSYANGEWAQAFLTAERETQYDENFFISHNNREKEIENEVSESMQPWLHILEDSIQWLANITLLLSEKNRTGQLTTSQQSIWALIGASCTHSLAVRRLILSGLDSPARVTARTLDEHLCACIAFLHDEKLASKFHECETDEETADFWFKNLNTKALRKHLNAVERSFGMPQNLSDEMGNWRQEELATFSLAVHPSYIGAALTTYTQSPGREEYGLAFLGKASSFSERTLKFSCKRIWYFSCFGFKMLCSEHNSRPPIVNIEKENELHQMALIGAHVLQKLNAKYWDYQIDDYKGNSDKSIS